MIVAVNARLLIKNRLEGIGWFCHEVLSRIVIKNPNVTFYFFFDRKPSDDFIYSKNVIPIVIPPQARHPLLWTIWFEYSLKNQLKRVNADVLLSPDGYMPLNTKTRTLAIIHDIAFEHYPESIPTLAKKYYLHFFPKFAKQSTRIATVSEYSKQDIAKQYSIPENKIDVVFNGVNKKFHPASQQDIKDAKEKYSNGKDYFIFIGGLYRRKNIINLIKAFSSFRQDETEKVKLIVIGKATHHQSEIEKELTNNPYNEDIHFLGRVDNFELVNTLISGAIAMTYVSVFEGFGIPCLEAMRCGTAVLTSNTSSMPEVCGDAAHYVNPFDVKSISKGMKTVFHQVEYRKELVSRGFEREKFFNWDKTADLVWGSLLKTII